MAKQNRSASQYDEIETFTGPVRLGAGRPPEASSEGAEDREGNDEPFAEPADFLAVPGVPYEPYPAAATGPPPPPPLTLKDVDARIIALQRELRDAKAKAVEESPDVERVLDERKRLFRLRRALKVLDGQTILPGMDPATVA